MDPTRMNPCIVRRRRGAAALAVLLLAAIVTLMPQRAEAWKPKHHIYTGNEAIAEILAGDDAVTIDGNRYAVPAAVAEAVRNFPDYYRAGCTGPDGYPDIVFGQAIIHPDWKENDGADNGTYTYEWLAHIHDAAWDYYNARGGNAEGQQALAFMFGFLTHAAGDLWGHTFINSFAGGPWPDLPDGDLRIAVRHIIAETYVTNHVPDTALGIAIPVDFINQTFIYNSVAIDMSDNATVSSAFGIPYFVRLRQSLVSERNSIDCDWYEPWDWLDCAKREYLDAWIDDIDDGLAVWASRMGHISWHFLVDEADNHMDQAKDHIEQFAYDHLLSMYGAPDFVGGFLDDWDAVTEWVEGLIGIDIPGPGDLVVYIIEQTYGVDFDELKDYFSHAEAYINQPPLFAADTSDRLDALMHLNGGSTFDPELFYANRNTITTAKLVLLGPDQLNEVLAAYEVGPLYGGANAEVPEGMWENAMLGFIRTLDGDHQWRRIQYDQPGPWHSEGMPLWVDCQARELVFRTIFNDWEQHDPPANFPKGQDECECWNDLPPTIDVVFNRDVLWPPNHKMSFIRADVTVEDDCDPNPGFALVSIESNEPDNGRGDGNTTDDIQGADIGLPDVEYTLRAERMGGGDGRIYTITYRAWDNEGHADTTSFYICVPHDRSGNACASTGFTADGLDFADGETAFILVIPSATNLEGAARPGVMRIDPGRTVVGNHLAQIGPRSARVAEVTGDGLDDLVLVFPTAAAMRLFAGPESGGQSVGLRYEDAAGQGYVVPDIFGLGVPLELRSLRYDPLNGGLAGAGEGGVPAVTALTGIRPNPFNPSATISFGLAATGHARIDVYDLRGVLVRTLADDVLGPGSYERTWDGRNNRGESVASGVYFVRLVTPGVAQTMKAILVK